MRILALEFSSAQRSVAVQQSPAPGIDSLAHEAVQSGAANALFALIDEALHRAALEREQIELLAVGLGPGSYVGIRAAIALAQGWQLGREVKLVGLSSAECVAAQAHADGLRGSVAVVIDAQRGEFYLGRYELGSSGWTELAPLQIVAPAAITECSLKGQLLIGPDLDQRFPQARNVWPRAGALAKMALTRQEFINGENLQPIYLRQTTFVKAPPPRVLPP